MLCRKNSSPYNSIYFLSGFDKKLDALLCFKITCFQLYFQGFFRSRWRINLIANYIHASSLSTIKRPEYQEARVEKKMFRVIGQASQSYLGRFGARTNLAPAIAHFFMNTALTPFFHFSSSPPGPRPPFHHQAPLPVGLLHALPLPALRALLRGQGARSEAWPHGN